MRQLMKYIAIAFVAMLILYGQYEIYSELHHQAQETVNNHRR